MTNSRQRRARRTARAAERAQAPPRVQTGPRPWRTRQPGGTTTTARPDALAVWCPRCGVDAGDPCLNALLRPVRPHVQRLDRARQAHPPP